MQCEKGIPEINIAIHVCVARKHTFPQNNDVDVVDVVYRKIERIGCAHGSSAEQKLV